MISKYFKQKKLIVLIVVLILFGCGYYKKPTNINALNSVKAYLICIVCAQNLSESRDSSRSVAIATSEDGTLYILSKDKANTKLTFSLKEFDISYFQIKNIKNKIQNKKLSVTIGEKKCQNLKFGSDSIICDVTSSIFQKNKEPLAIVIK